jgi:hypothetical protein
MERHVSQFIFVLWRLYWRNGGNMVAAEDLPYCHSFSNTISSSYLIFQYKVQMTFCTGLCMLQM